MMTGPSMWAGSWMWPLIVAVLVLAAGLVAVLLLSARRGAPEEAAAAVEILRERLARGDIDETEYRERLAVLQAGSAGRTGRPPWRRGSPLVAAAVALLLVATIAVAAVATRPTPPPFGGFGASSTCDAPALPGRTVNVTLSNMGGGMMGGSMPMWGGRDSPGGSMMGYMMSVTAEPSTFPPGEVSFRVWNAGSIVHEMVVLPLSLDGAGTRPIGSDGRASEAGSLGEASKTCGAGAGDGIAPGAVGWVTLRLAPGFYELICNLPGHYAGMFTELDIR